MQFIEQDYTQTLEIKQSKFISHLIPYEIYKETLQKLKESHPKARHFVVAYRYMNDFKQVVEHSSDDGEPKGTSGKPTLMVLQGMKMINTAVITVRYFGGTKLGTGGLVRAYGEVTNLVLESANIIEYKEEIQKTIVFEYTHLRKVEYECGLLEITIREKIFSERIKFILESDETSMHLFFDKLDRLVITS